MATPITVGAAGGEYMESVVLVEWRVGPGDPVRRGDVVAVVETAKAATEVEAARDGVVSRLLVQPGEEVDVRAPLGLIGETADDTEADAGEPAAPRTGSAADRGEDRRDVRDGPANGRIVASPVARKIAEAAGVPLVRVRGTGANGRIKRRDVEAAIRDRGGVPMPDGAESGTVRDGLLAVYRSGPADAGAPVVMLHGFAADAMMWHPVEQALAARHPVVRLDLPCHGRSPRPRVGGFRQFARLVTEAVRTLDAGPVHLVGHSLGGAVAVAVAEAMPFGVRSLTLLAPAGLGAEIDGAVLRGLCQAGRVESLAPWLRRMVVDQTLIGDDYARAAMALRADPGLREAQADLADVLFPDGTQSFNLSRTLRAVRAPTRIVWGRADDVIPWQHALSAPGTVALHLPPAIGHLAHIEMPDLVVAVIEAQVEAAEAGAGDGTGAGNHGSWRAGAPASVPEVREAHHA